MGWNWNGRPTKADIKHRIGGEKAATVYSIGKYLVTVPGEEELEVTFTVPSERGNPRESFPNLQVADGELRLPVTDLVEVILARIAPVELAAALWQNDEVKEAFMDCLKTRYNEQGIDDADRRKFIAEVKEAIHDKALDVLAGKMASLEHEINRRSHGFQEIHRINETLRQFDVKTKRFVGYGEKGGKTGEPVYEEVPLQFNMLDRPTPDGKGGWTHGELEVAGKSWEEARAYWRKEISKRFPAPPEPEPT